MSNSDGQTVSLAERLGSVRVGARRDLEVSRHVFRGQPTYIIRDPITFDSHRFSPSDYQLFIAIDSSRTLSEIFADQVAREILEQEQEESFYQFVFSLHRLSFLNLPMSDDKILYRRYQARQSVRRRQKLMGFLFLQIPLINPNAFLERTMPLMRWLYSPITFGLWLLLVGSAAYVAAAHGSELLRPANGLLATRNLVFMWFTLISLKVVHEFGHAYACKRFGGHVPEMGIYLIAFTPCAYVNATAAWGFSRKLERLIVSLAGVYVEIAIAAVAVFVWAATGPSLLNSVAYNVMFLASAVTLLFNINPLMRYDGYYVLSDFLEVPNLRSRARQYVIDLAKRWTLGVTVAETVDSRRLRIILFSFGICATVYRMLVLVSISALIATKFFLVGVGLAGFYVGSTIVGFVRRLSKYLWHSEETANVRYRAIAVGVAVFILLPTIIGLVPMPMRVCIAGTVEAEYETVVRAAVPGFVERVDFERAQRTQAGALLAELSNTETAENIARAAAEVAASQIRLMAYQTVDPDQARREVERGGAYQAELEYYAGRERDLRITAPEAGQIVDGLRPIDAGRFVEAGQAIATIISGKRQVRAILTAEELTATQPCVGQVVRFRDRADSASMHSGKIVKINPAGVYHTDLVALTHLAGGDVVIEPGGGETAQAYWELTLALDGEVETLPKHGSTGMIQLPGAAEPIAKRIYRNVVRFMNRLLES